MRIVGLLLAGGRSRRFGSEKAVFQWVGGLRLMDAPLAALDAVCDGVAVSAREGSAAAAHARALGLPVLTDPPDHAEGPLSGVLAGLSWAKRMGADWLVTAPCDAATLKTDTVRNLASAIRTGAPAAIASSPRGLEPLLAAWPVSEGLEKLGRLLDGGHHPAVRDVLADLAAVPVDGHDGINVNRLSDLPDPG